MIAHMTHPKTDVGLESKSTSANRTFGELRQRAPYELRVMMVIVDPENWTAG